ncbi:hypothetical protein ILYODFUR_000726 [Ilyodon furcidens]|uniref:Uncharacterized protein n=1 Tax=Ilyodon furcidens TaxID=33524 RepID=A0ABV0ST52_9TELE
MYFPKGTHDSQLLNNYFPGNYTFIEGSEKVEQRRAHTCNPSGILSGLGFMCGTGLLEPEGKLKNKLLPNLSGNYTFLPSCRWMGWSDFFFFLLGIKVKMNVV